LINRKTQKLSVTVGSQTQIGEDQRKALALLDLAVEAAKLAGIEPAEMLTRLLHITSKSKPENTAE